MTDYGNEKFTIGFTYTDEFGNHYEASSDVPVFGSLGPHIQIEIGKQLNTFLKQVGFVRRNDYILMEDITEEEFELLSDYLTACREGSDHDDN